MHTRLDHQIICQHIEKGEKVLDLGCGTGELMSLLVKEKSASVQGIELDDEAMHQCVEKGLMVFQGDIETGLVDYPDNCFDTVILNQSMQEVRKVDFIISESLRVGKKVIVGFPNFAHLPSRFALFFLGRMPISDSLPYLWYETPNVRFLSIKDFKALCVEKQLKILTSYYLGARRRVKIWPNLLAMNAIFVLTKERVLLKNEKIPEY